ncbi:MAG: hypothetical protein ACXAB2_03965 [Candidatus Hodarchaeales archaeon]
MPDLISIFWTLVSFGLVVLLGGFLVIGILVLIYLIITGNRWD